MVRLMRFIVSLMLVLSMLLGYRTTSMAAPIDDVTLGRAASYSMLAGSAITKGGASTTSGDLPSRAGIFPTAVATTLANSFVLTGSSAFENATASASDAQTDLAAAIASIALLAPTTVSALFSNLTLTPGVYSAPPASALAITFGLVLDAGGDPNARFIFRTDAALNIDAAITVHLVNGAQERNVFWMVGTAVTIGAGSDIPGNFLAVSAVTTGDTTIIRGSILCETAVTLGANSQIIYDHLTTGIIGGALSISAPASISLGSAGSPGSISTIMGNVEVTDLRGVPSGGSWVASASATDLTPTSGKAIPATGFGYSAGAITSTGTVTISVFDQTNLSVQQTIVSASGISGSDSALWAPTLTLNIPAGIANGAYSGTITQSVA